MRVSDSYIFQSVLNALIDVHTPHAFLHFTLFIILYAVCRDCYTLCTIHVTQHGFNHHELIILFRVDVIPLLYVRVLFSPQQGGVRKVSLRRMHTSCILPPLARSFVAFLDVLSTNNLKRLHWHTSLDIMSVLTI